LARYLDVIPQYRKVEAGAYAGAAADLKRMLPAEQTMLTRRVDRMADTLDVLTPLIESLH
ncbi:MAG: hypothetical protein FJ000_07380, partial [Actinobacteria bacterium]|nr:hypothetical protein [Actinomycetota bacterium]